MEILTSIPISMDKPETISPVVEAAHTRIAQRAYKLFLQRGRTNGSAADDWLAAEAELVVCPRVKRYYYHDGMKIELRLPTADPSNLSVCVGTSRLVVAADPGPDGRHLLLVFDLPWTASPHEVEAEQNGRVLQIAIPRLEDLAEEASAS